MQQHTPVNTSNNPHHAQVNTPERVCVCEFPVWLQFLQRAFLMLLTFREVLIGYKLIMIRKLQVARKSPFTTLARRSIYRFCTHPVRDAQGKNRFQGYMIPVMYPIWVSTWSLVELSPPVSNLIKDHPLSQIAALAYAPNIKTIDLSLPLDEQFYKQATLCNVIHNSKNHFYLEPLKKIKIQSIQKEVEYPELPSFKVPEYVVPKPVLKVEKEFSLVEGEWPERKSEIGFLLEQKNNVLYKVQGELIDSPQLQPTILNEMKYKKMLRLAYMTVEMACRMNGIPFDARSAHLFKNELIDLQKVAEKSLGLIEPLIFVTQIRNKQMFPKLSQDIRQLFEAETLEHRLDLNIAIIHNQLMKCSLSLQIMMDVSDDQRKKINQMQAFQMSSTLSEALDGKKGKDKFVQRVKAKFMENKPPAEMLKAFDDECTKYLEEEESYSANTKDYIETLASIPYGVQTPESFDMERARDVLNHKHYGMQEVKDFIYEFIAVGQLKGTQKGKVLCFIGPPGVGKTTFASSVAEALGRKFESISLGGVIDSSTLKGHRRTYQNSYSGKIIEALRRCESNNPVILLDEIDKMGGSGYHGDPRSDLLEILDPNQNASFVDNYVDHPVDLSNVLFICSANYIERLSQPLLDRLEKVELTSYTDDQKIQITEKHILPKALQESGLKDTDYTLEKDTLKAVIDQFTFGEPGVRYLEKLVRKILQKIAVKVVEGKEKLPISVNPSNLEDFLDESNVEKIDYKKLGVGVAVGLGESEVQGGRITIIEVVQSSYKNDLKQGGLAKTGNLGDILKQSVEIAYTFARRYLREKFSNSYLDENEVHLHAPEGHSKKNGAGESLTIASALVSLALKKMPKREIAVAGELSLQGRIMAVGNLKEKLLTAKRHKIHELILPNRNKEEVLKYSSSVLEGLKFHFVDTFDEVEKILFE